MTTCRGCKEDKVRVFSGVYERRGRVKVNVDDRGRRWNGRLCPGCECARISLYQKKKSDKEACFEDNRDLGPAHPRYRKHDRRCGKCDKKLHHDRYFYHVGCEPLHYCGYNDLAESYEFHPWR